MPGTVAPNEILGEAAEQPQSAVERMKGLGYVVFPCDPATKRPKVKWQDDPPRNGWTFRDTDLIGVRLPLGTVVLDIDDPATFAKSGLHVPTTGWSPTRREGGRHYYFTSDGRPIAQTQLRPQGYDTRVGGSGYVIAWHPEDWTPADNWPNAPEWLYEKPRQQKQEHVLGEDGTVPPGTRDAWLASLAGAMRHRGMDYEAILAALRAVAGMVPTKNDEDFKRIAASFARYEAGTEGIVNDGEEKREVVTNLRSEWPEPPRDAAFRGVAGDIVRAIAPYTEADPVGMLGTLLAIFGTLAGDGPTLYQGGRQKANIFVSLVGETSTGRKGTAYNVIREFLTEVMPNWRDVIVTGLGSGEGLFTRLEGNEDRRALVYEGEFGQLLTAMTREGSTLSDVVRNAWDGVALGHYVANKKASGTIHDHHVGILANITNIELATKLSSVNKANGFANRFIWLAVRRPHLVPHAGPIAEYALPYADEFIDALVRAQNSERMQFTPEARKYWEHLYINRPAKAGMLGELTTRADAYVARLSMIYALLDGTTQIGPEHLDAAEALWEYAERSARYIFGDATGNKTADAIVKELNLSSPMGWEEMKRSIGVYRAAEMEEAVDLLQRLGRVEVTKITRGGGHGSGKGSGGRPRRELSLVF